MLQNPSQIWHLLVFDRVQQTSYKILKNEESLKTTYIRPSCQNLNNILDEDKSQTEYTYPYHPSHKLLMTASLANVQETDNESSEQESQRQLSRARPP